MDYFVFILLCCWVFIDLYTFINRLNEANLPTSSNVEEEEESVDLSTSLYGWLLVIFIIVGLSSSRYFYMLIAGVAMFLMGDLFAKSVDKYPNRRKLLLWIDLVITMGIALTCFLFLYNDSIT